MPEPNVIVINPHPENESSPPQGSDGDAETLRLAQLAGQAVESSRQSAMETAALRAELEAERESRRALESRVTDLVMALEEEEEEDQEKVTVITPPPPPPPPEPETPEPPKKEKSWGVKLLFGEVD